MINKFIIAVTGLYFFYWYVCFVFGSTEGVLIDKIDITIGVVVLTILPAVIIVMTISEIWNWIKE